MVQKMLASWTLTLSILAAWWQGVSMLRLVELSVPKYTIRGQPVHLKCHYDLEGEGLDSVRWFKGPHEFFRYIPGEETPFQILNVTGITVDLQHSTDTLVALKSVDVDGSGVYKCEVSGEAPTFQTVSESKQMIVVDLPNSGGPHLEGTKPRYAVGETIRVNCSSERSRPAAKLQFFVNNEPVEEASLRHYPIFIDEDELETSVLGLEFKVRKKNFREGNLRIKCLATVGDVYFRSNEESIQSVDKLHRAPALESRDPYTSGKRDSSVWINRMDVILFTPSNKWNGRHHQNVMGDLIEVDTLQIGLPLEHKAERNYLVVRPEASTSSRSSPYDPSTLVLLTLLLATILPLGQASSSSYSHLR